MSIVDGDSVSKIKLSFSHSDDKKTITCRGTNEVFSQHRIQDDYTLNVLCKLKQDIPKISSKLD